MKTIIWQLFLLLVVVYNYKAEAANAAEANAMAKKVREECIKEGSLSAEDTARIMADELFSPKYKEASETIQCFLSCIFKKIGVFVAEGKQEPQAFMAYLENRFSDKKDKIKSAVDKCENIKSANSCEVAYKYAACIEEYMKA